MTFFCDVMINQRVISQSELERIRHTSGLTQTHIPAMTTYKSMSVARVSKWANTIHAARKLVTQQREERLLKEENERRKQDFIEARVQFEERHAIIERANNIVKSDNERTRLLTSALMLSDVLAERDNQMRIKSHIEELESIRNVKYDQLVKHNFAEMKRREAKEEYESRLGRVGIALDQKKQIQDIEEQYRGALRRRQEERQEMIERTIGYEYEDYLRKQEAKEKAIKNTLDSEKAHEFMENLKLRDDTLCEAELDEIDEYAYQKSVRDMHIKERHKELLTRQIRKREAMAQAGRDREEQPRVGSDNADKPREVTSLIIPEDPERATLMKKLQQSVIQETKSRIQREQSMILAAEASKTDSLDDVVRLNEELEHIEKIEEQRKVHIRQELSRNLALQTKFRCERRRKSAAPAVAPADMTNGEVYQFRKHVESAVQECLNEDKNLVPLIVAARKYQKSPDL